MDVVIKIGDHQPDLKNQVYHIKNFVQGKGSIAHSRMLLTVMPAVVRSEDQLRLEHSSTQPTSTAPILPFFTPIWRLLLEYFSTMHSVIETVSREFSVNVNLV